MGKAAPINQNSIHMLNWGLRMAAYGASTALGARLITPLSLKHGVIISLINATLVTIGTRKERKENIDLASMMAKAVIIAVPTFAILLTLSIFHSNSLANRISLKLTPKMTLYLVLLNQLAETMVVILYKIQERFITPSSPGPFDSSDSPIKGGEMARIRAQLHTILNSNQ